MVKIESNKETNTHRILLRPNQSISWRLSLIFIGFITITCLSIGIAFTFLGATLILPFAGLEVILVTVCVYLVLQKGYRQEVIIMTQDKLRIERGIGKSQKDMGVFQDMVLFFSRKTNTPLVSSTHRCNFQRRACARWRLSNRR